MPSFRYRALTQTGSTITGVLEAVSEASAIQQIRQQGHYPISAVDADKGGWQGFLTKDLWPQRGPSRRDLGIVTQELSSLLDAGLELDRALQIVLGMTETRRLKAPLERVLGRIRNGTSIGDAFSADPIFPKFYVNMIRAGELGGNLGATLKRLADYLSSVQATREAVTSALVYPAILLVTAGFSIAVILIFVIPQFEPLFRDAGRGLPLSTRIVMGIGNFVSATWWLMLLCLLGGFYWLRNALHRPEFRKRFDRASLRLPIIGELLLQIEMERFNRTLGALLSNGVTLPVSLNITSETLSNTVLADAVKQTAISLREGEALAERLEKHGLFPAMTLDLLRVGEETGRLDEMLLRLADFYEQGIKHKITRLLSLLMPVLTVFLGMLVAGLIASMLVAVLSANDLAF